MARLILHKLFQDGYLKKSTSDVFMVDSLIKQCYFLVPSFQGHSRYTAELGPPPEFRQPPSLSRKETLN